VQVTLPWSIKGSRARRCNTCLRLACRRRRPWVCFSFLFFPPTIPIFSHSFFFSKISRQSAAPAALPQSSKGSRARRCHICPQLTCRRRRPWVFPSLLFFFHHLDYFSWLLFYN
jgi:hypothetical protein